VLLACGLLVGVALSAAGCVEADETFTQGRLRATCNSAIPVCDTRAACVLGDDEYLEGSFPGGEEFIVRTESGDRRLVVRFLLREMISPGTEMLVRAHQSGCAEFDERRLRDVDLFERAGDDRILQFELDLQGRGDHLVEIFSDMAADFSMTTTVE
jgi:hypothetical protein